MLGKPVLPIICAAVNVLLLIWTIGQIWFSRDAKYQPTVLRIVISFGVTALLASHGYRRKSVSLSGMVAGALIAFCMFLTHYTIAISLLITFFATTRATRFGDTVKSRFEANFKVGGQRDWLQIVCNLGIANIAVLLMLKTAGVGAEAEIDFTTNYTRSWLLVGALGAISCALGDTLSSELGPVLAEDVEPVLITSLRTVPKGTNGGITIAGLLAACAGGFLIGLGSWITQSFVPSSPAPTHWHSPQWPILFFCLYAGLLGSLVDSLLGATLQYTGYDHFRKRITEVPPETGSTSFVEHISGRPVLDNHDVNLLSICIMAIATPLLASYFWPAGVPFT